MLWPFESGIEDGKDMMGIWERVERNWNVVLLQMMWG